jgi:hypothetical protein
VFSCYKLLMITYENDLYNLHENSLIIFPLLIIEIAYK